MAIVKILARHSASYASLVRYVLRYIGDEIKVEQTRFYTNNLRSRTIDGFVREFVENESFRRNHRSDQVMLTHEIVSFSAFENKRKITQEMIDGLAGEYMRLRGDKSVMLGACHHDREHFHLHFCVSALEYRTGKSYGLNRAQLRELKLRFQEYHKAKYPELTFSFPAHGHGGRQLTHGQWHAKRRDQIIGQVKDCLTQSASQSQFLDRLRDCGLHHYVRAGKPQGIEYDGVKFRFSRLIGKEVFESLPIEISEEEKALAEIRATRARQREREERSRDTAERER